MAFIEVNFARLTTIKRALVVGWDALEGPAKERAAKEMVSFRNGVDG